MKKHVVLLFTFVFALLILFPAQTAKASSAASSTPHVYDDAGLFTAEQKSSLQKKIDEFSGAHNADIVILTINDADGESSKVIADDFYDYNGFKPDGVLLLINMDARETYISTSGFMINILYNSRIDSLLDMQVSYLKDARYYDAMARSIEHVTAYVKQGSGSVAPGGSGGSNSISLPSVETVLFGALIGLAAAAITCSVIYSRYKKNYKPVPYDYRSMSKLTLTARIDEHIDTDVISVYDPPPPPPRSSGGGSSFGGGGGFSSTHTSSSGTSHGGGGRGF